MGVALAIAIVAVLQSVLFLLIALPLAPAARVLATKATLGFGPRLFSVDVVDVKLFPFTSWASFAGMNPYEEEPPAPAWPFLLWLDAPRGRRLLLLVLAPRFAAALFPLFVLGPARTWAAIGRGVPQIFAGFGWGRPLLERVAQEPWVTLVALVFCKALAFSLVNLPFDFVQGIATRSMDRIQKALAKVRGLMMFVIMAAAVAWLVTWIRWMI